MSSAIRCFSEGTCNFIFKCKFPKSLAARVIILHGLNILSSISTSGAESIAFDMPCIAVDNCANITGEKMCNTSIGMCACAEGSVRWHFLFHCVPYVGLGEDCQDSEQCRQKDSRAQCNTWSKRCQCSSGYEETENNGTRLCSKSRLLEGEPYIVHIFSGLDTVHIVLGCLTGGLALLACFAGIIQLVRKKWNGPRCSNENGAQFSPDLGFSTASAPSQSQPYSDSQFTMSPPSGGDFAFVDDNITAPPTPGTLGDEDYVVTPPPTYEEALQQSARRKAGSTTTV